MQIATPLFLGICVASSAGLNGIVIYIFAKIGMKKLTFKDSFMLSMSIGDLIQSMFGYSLEIYSIVARKGGEIQTKQGIEFCKASGFIVTFLALSSTAHLTALAYDRYLTICKPFMATRIHGSYILCTAFISSCWTYGFVWAAFPLIGWSGYELESDALRCSIDWASKKTKDHLYIIFLFIFCFIIPVSVMCYSFYRVKQELREMQSRASNLFGRESKAAKDNVRAEKRHTRLAIVMCMVFIITWMPYTLLSFWASFFTHVAELPVTLATVSAIIAKSSTMFNPVIYTIMHKRFRQSILATPFGKVLCLSPKISPEDSSFQVTEKA
ncbi:blue-sensitive opsin-like [Rhopilema esculentum]|uniref:blue-sensitive opsin-like n=1 Tax=Rhopilema esculentum TaxID=499914 RepID=UPI0031D28809|eukprot:gene3351-1700_t